jgi:hypothetical protein
MVLGLIKMDQQLKIFRFLLFELEQVREPEDEIAGNVPFAVDDIGEKACGGKPHLLGDIAIREKSMLMLVLLVKVFKQLAIVKIFEDIDHTALSPPL